MKPTVGEVDILHFDDGPLGSGFRMAIVCIVGRQFITVLSPSTLDTARIGINEWELLRPRPIDGPERIGAIRNAKRKRRLFKKLGVPFARVETKMLLSRIDGACNGC